MLGCTVSELGERMSLAEFAEWQVMDRVERVGCLGNERRHAELLAGLATGALQHPNQLRRWLPHELSNTDPWGEPPPEQTNDPDIRRQVAALNGQRQDPNG